MRERRPAKTSPLLPLLVSTSASSRPIGLNLGKHLLFLSNYVWAKIATFQAFSLTDYASLAPASEISSGS
jgi:hypothetical protein